MRAISRPERLSSQQRMAFGMRLASAEGDIWEPALVPPQRSTTQLPGMDAGLAHAGGGPPSEHRQDAVFFGGTLARPRRSAMHDVRAAQSTSSPRRRRESRTSVITSSINTCCSRIWGNWA